MADISSSESRARCALAAETLIHHSFRCWYFGDSIGFEGLLAASELLGEPRYEEFAHGFFRGWASRRKPFVASDNTAPGLAMCGLAASSADTDLRAALSELAQYLYAGRRRCRGTSITFENALEALRAPYGGAALTGADAKLMADPGAGVWLDCMHFDAPFYARLYSTGVGAEWSERAVDEILAYCSLLVDEELGLLHHYWLERTGQTYIRGWGRGQGWALLGLMDVIEYAARSTPRYGEVIERALGLARAMLSFQLADGSWWAMVHEPQSGPESSTAAFMATAFFRGMRLGVLPASSFAEPAERAFAAMQKNVNEEGLLLGVSAAVHAALIQEHYWHVPRGSIVPWGQGPMLTATLARANWLSQTREPAGQ